MPAEETEAKAPREQQRKYELHFDDSSSMKKTESVATYDVFEKWNSYTNVIRNVMKVMN